MPIKAITNGRFGSIIEVSSPAQSFMLANSYAPRNLPLIIASSFNHQLNTNKIVMREYDANRVEFYSVDNMANGHYLSKAEALLRIEIKSNYEDINDVLELYNIKQYIDNDLCLKSWTKDDITDFKQKATEYGKIVGRFISNINDSNVICYYEQLLRGYINSFWELVNNQKIYKQISADNLATILSNEPYVIQSILTHKSLVTNYNIVLRDFLLTYSQSAEILLSFYEVKNDFHHKEMFLPKSLTIQDKENVISNYLDSDNVNSNYFQLIQNARDKSDFKISDKTRLKAKRRYKKETDKLFEERGNNSLFKYGVSISFPENREKIKDGHIEDTIVNHSYSLDYIKSHYDFYSLFLNFIILFEYLDSQNRVNLVSKKNQMGVMERVLGVRSQNEYIFGIAFNINEMTSQAQILAYSVIINALGDSVENILQHVFTSIFHEKYKFANNAQLSMPSANIPFFEKVRLLAPEFESVIKQFKLFVEDGKIDSELLQISSSPCTIKEIPSLIQNKYVYMNDDNNVIVNCVNLFFSDQTLLAYVEPYQEKHFHNLFDLLANEEVNFNNYEEHQKPQINYLISEGFLFLDKNNFVQITNLVRVLILKDLYENEVASFYHYPIDFKMEAEQMATQNMIFFESTLLSKPEQSYFNYFLNKSEFTNGLDLRNSYLHGTQANPEELTKHEYAYFAYLKLLVLVLLKIEDDLFISQVLKHKA